MCLGGSLGGGCCVCVLGARGACRRAGRCSAGACGQRSLSSAVLVTQRLNLESDINTAAAAQTLPGRAALTHGPLSPLLLAGRGPARPSGALLGGRLQSPHHQPLVRRYIRKNLIGVNRSCLAAFIFRSLFFLLVRSSERFLCHWRG